jgi:purine nucleoside permease
VVDSLLTGEPSGTALALESAYRVGSPVVHAIVENWTKDETIMPGH